MKYSGPLTKLCVLFAFVLTLATGAFAQAPAGIKVYTQVEFDRANALFTKGRNAQRDDSE
ncbi:MAG: hypothetical protein ACXW18_00600 [Pyrinomonadaceae bacterium]